MRLEYRGVITENYTYVHTIDKPWLLFDNNNDPYQMRNLIEDSAYSELRNNLYEKMQKHMNVINDEMLPRQHYYKKFGIDLDHRGKLVDLVENIYDRNG